MKDASEYNGIKCMPHRRTLLTSIAGMILGLICLVTPASTATFEEQLQEFLQGPPFEFTVEFQGQKLPIHVEKVEGPQPTLSLPPQAPKTGDPALERNMKFAEEMEVDDM